MCQVFLTWRKTILFLYFFFFWSLKFSFFQFYITRSQCGDDDVFYDTSNGGRTPKLKRGLLTGYSQGIHIYDDDGIDSNGMLDVSSQSATQKSEIFNAAYFQETEGLTSLSEAMERDIREDIKYNDGRFALNSWGYTSDF